MPNKKLDLVGQRFAKLLVIAFAGQDKMQQSLFSCICDCGKNHIVRGYMLRNGNTKSCGCLRVTVGKLQGLQTKKHGMIGTPTYKTWQSMKNRCLNPNHNKYKFYGGLGVKIAEEWNTFEGFLEDMGVRPNNMTLDRLNPFKDYTKENCRWADNETQIKNTRRNYFKENLLCL
jgi:hypothetical protein